VSKWKKLIQKISEERAISYEEAESVLLKLGFELEIRGSHHVFRKKGYERNISIKRRSRLLSYQIRDLKEVLRDHEC
jgi:predicted RNA binding protein YcfA (HicA-like mRNA interferase family)